jgi:hypothetical protein
MALAYTPGLKVKKETTVQKMRRLPIAGEVLVKNGENVDFDTIVARTKVPGNVETIRASQMLGIEGDDVETLGQYMLKKVGANVSKGEIIAKRISLFGMSKAFVEAPIDGTIEHVSDITGQITIREAPEPVEIKAYIPGRIVEVMSNEGVVVESGAALIQGIFGIGGETHGQIKVAVKSPEEALTEDMLDTSDKGKIVVGGAIVTGEALKKAASIGARGIVSGGVQDKDLRDLLGYEIGVAITGQEESVVTLIITEGFGKMRMSTRTYELLKSNEGKEAAMNGATQIRAGVIRPEIIIPQGKIPEEKPDSEQAIISKGMQPGMTIRIIAEPYFGAIGTISALPTELEKVESESSVRILAVELEGGEKAVVPRANVEIIEH